MSRTSQVNTQNPRAALRGRDVRTVFAGERPLRDDHGFYSAPCGCEYQETPDSTLNDPCDGHTWATNAARACRAGAWAAAEA